MTASMTHRVHRGRSRDAVMPYTNRMPPFGMALKSMAGTSQLGGPADFRCAYDVTKRKVEHVVSTSHTYALPERLVIGREATRPAPNSQLSWCMPGAQCVKPCTVSTALTSAWLRPRSKGPGVKHGAGYPWRQLDTA